MSNGGFALAWAWIVATAAVTAAAAVTRFSGYVWLGILVGVIVFWLLTAVGTRFGFFGRR